MLFLNTGTIPRQPFQPGPHAADLSGITWFDLFHAEDAERAAAERATGLIVPADTELAEIESSSRLSYEDDVLTLSTPMTYLDAAGQSRTAPLGFVLSTRHLITVRAAQLPVFDGFAERWHGGCSAAAFIGLLEAITDRLADVLELIGAKLNDLSHRIFRAEGAERNAAREDARLRTILREIGLAGERTSNVRDSLLGLQRIVSFSAVTAPWFPADMQPRVKTLLRDIGSLAEYDSQVTNKVQFLLDATLGFINIEQANGIKVLTVVSVVGVPPTLIASIYGMNFKTIPELQWEYGYAYGLLVIALSAILPLLYFKRRGWI